MQYNFVLIRTEKGGKYARKILNSVKWLNENKYPQHEFFVEDLTIAEFMDLPNNMFVEVNDWYPNNTIIHARCANPRTEWTIKLRGLEEVGYKVVNSVDTIELTSNKLACSLHLQGKVNHPKSWEYSKNMTLREIAQLRNEISNSLNEPEFIIAKPLTSLEQGANVRKINFRYWPDNLKEELDKVPGNKIVIQEFIPYTALHRVIVIGGKALPYTFVDYANDPRKNGEWKVSCCLNRTTMKLNENAPYELLKLAEDTQREVGGIINFIDIFEVPVSRVGHLGMYNHPGVEYTNAEINTACSLNIHEKLAKLAGRRDWNIHYRIAKELVSQLLGV